MHARGKSGAEFSADSKKVLLTHFRPCSYQGKTLRFMGVFIIIILVYWSECNLPAAVGTTSKAIAPPIPSVPSSAIHIRWVGEGMHCQEGQVKQWEAYTNSKGSGSAHGRDCLKHNHNLP